MAEEEKEYQIEECEANTDNRDFFEEAIKNHATWTLRYASDKLKDDKDLIMDCAKVDGQILYYASKRLRDDKEVVLTAVTQKPLIVKYASAKLRADIDVAKATLTNSLKDKHFTEIKSYLEPEVYDNPEIQAIINPPETEENK